jgi:hypothetical protein
MGVGGDEGLDCSDEELPLSEDSSLEEGGEEPDVDGGRLYPTTPTISAPEGSVILSPNVLLGRPVSRGCSCILEKSRG